MGRVYCPACQANYPPDWKACPKDATTLLKSAQIGKYRIEGLLGVGGMGAVYRAANPDIRGARVAIKVMNPAVAGAEATRERFKREAAAVAALRTAHVVKVYDFDADADGALYLVMELLDGHALRDEIAPGPNHMDLARVQMVMDGALRGLAAAHRASIVHRDLKPENIFIADTDDGEVPKLLDFGIARVKSPDQNLTHTGSLMGTASYMAIEQIAANAGTIGPWTDVYAMGAILYEMLAGTQAFGGSTITEVLQRVLQAEVVPLETVRAGLPPAVYALVARCMSTEPGERPQDAEAMRRALLEAQLVAPGTTVPPRFETRPDPTPRRAAEAIAPTEGRDTPMPQLAPVRGAAGARAEQPTEALSGVRADASRERPGSAPPPSRPPPSRPARRARALAARARRRRGRRRRGVLAVKALGGGTSSGGAAVPRDAAVVAEVADAAAPTVEPDAPPPAPEAPPRMVRIAEGEHEIGLPRARRLAAGDPRGGRRVLDRRARADARRARGRARRPAPRRDARADRERRARHAGAPRHLGGRRRGVRGARQAPAERGRVGGRRAHDAGRSEARAPAAQEQRGRPRRAGHRLLGRSAVRHARRAVRVDGRRRRRPRRREDRARRVVPRSAGRQARYDPPAPDRARRRLRQHDRAPLRALGDRFVFSPRFVFSQRSVMKRSSFARTLLVLSSLVLALGVAHADRQKSCPDPGDILVSGACVKRQVAPRNSAVEAYQQAIDALDTKPKLAFELFEKWCKAKHGPSCTQLGLMHEVSRGRVVRKDVARATELYKRACELGDGAGCRRHGMIALNARGPAEPQQLGTARAMLERGCGKDDPFACSMFGMLLDNAMGGPMDAKRAQTTFQKATKLFDQRCPLTDKPARRDGEACWQLGYILKMGYGVAKDLTRARRAYELSCDHNYGTGCMSYIELQREQNKPRGDLVDLYRKACHLEVASACSTAASEIANKDRGKSREPAELAKLACDLEAKECGMLGELYRLGWSGFAKDERKASEIYRDACDFGEQFWCFKYAVRLHDGKGVAADKARAITLLEGACADKIEDSCEQLVRYLRPDNGGTDANDARAQIAADAACKRGSHDGCFLAAWGIRYDRRGPRKVGEQAGGAESLPLFESACTGDIWSACSAAGDIYARGLGVPADPAKALARYTSACFPKSGAGSQRGCTALSKLAPVDGRPSADELLRAAARACALGSERTDCDRVTPSSASEIAIVTRELDPACADRGDEYRCFLAARIRFQGTSDDKQRAFELFNKQCTANQKLSCIGLADAMFWGIGTPKDVARAEALYEKRCDDTFGYACLQLGLAALERKDDAAAYRHFVRACDNDNGDGCNGAGYAYYTGRGVEWDATKALGYYRKGCEHGSAVACQNVGETLRYGIAAPKDLAESYKLYKQACDASGRWGCGGEGHFLATGTGGAPKDLKRAAELLRKACDGDGEYDSCAELAAVLEQLGGSVSEIAALRAKGRQRVEKAAESNPAYMYWLGVYFRDGIGSAKDPQRAREWFAKACDHFDPLGCVAAGTAFSETNNAADLDRARAYFEKGCGAHVDAACKGMAAVKARMAGGGTPGVVQAKKAGCCSGEVVPGAEVGLALAVLAFARRARRTQRTRRRAR